LTVGRAVLLVADERDERLARDEQRLDRSEVPNADGVGKVLALFGVCPQAPRPSRSAFRLRHGPARGRSQGRLPQPPGEVETAPASDESMYQSTTVMPSAA
jgi:hypothetical protein